MSIKKSFFLNKPIIGMVHLLPLPTSPLFKGNIEEIYIRAINEAKILESANIDALIVENFNDEPFTFCEIDPVVISLFSGIVREVKKTISIPVGVNVQFNAWEAELAIAYACNAEFIRVEVFIDTVISSMGIICPCASRLLRYRKILNTDVMIWADIQTKYTKNIVSQSLVQSAIDAENASADVLIVTGAATGHETSIESLSMVKDAVSLPVLAGSGTTIKNVKEILKVADGAIVGSAFKVGGKATNIVSYDKCANFMRIVKNR